MMRKTIASVFVLFVILANSYAAPEPALQVKAPQKTLFTDITVSDDTLIAVGKHGTIVTSQDGVAWKQAQVPVQTLLTAVTSVNSEKSWACGHDGTILFSQDNGNNWVVQQYLPEIGKPCLDIEFFDQNNGFAIGAYGMFYVTQDGGITWRNRFIDDFVHPDDKEYLAELKEQDIAAYEEETKFILPHFNRLLIHDKRFFLVGEMGLVAVSDDQGISWRRLDEFYPGSFFSVSPFRDDKLIVAGLRGNAFVGSMSELSFRRLDIETTATINSVLPAERSVLMFANSGFVFKYDDVVSQVQLETGHSILAAVPFKGNYVLATEKGLIAWRADK